MYHDKQAVMFQAARNHGVFNTSPGCVALVATAVRFWAVPLRGESSCHSIWSIGLCQSCTGRTSIRNNPYFYRLYRGGTEHRTACGCVCKRLHILFVPLCGACEGIIQQCSENRKTKSVHSIYSNGLRYFCHSFCAIPQDIALMNFQDTIYRFQ